MGSKVNEIAIPWSVPVSRPMATMVPKIFKAKPKPKQSVEEGVDHASDKVQWDHGRFGLGGTL